MAGGERRVLVVDDDLDIRSLVEDLLDQEGYIVRTAGNGREALDRLDEGLPDVILLDLAMPVMDGWTFLAAQQARPDLADIPVIVMSAHFRPTNGESRRSAAAMLTKPFDLERLLSLVAGMVS